MCICAHVCEGESLEARRGCGILWSWELEYDLLQVQSAPLTPETSLQSPLMAALASDWQKAWQWGALEPQWSHLVTGKLTREGVPAAEPYQYRLGVWLFTPTDITKARKEVRKMMDRVVWTRFFHWL